MLHYLSPPEQKAGFLDTGQKVCNIRSITCVYYGGSVMLGKKRKIKQSDRQSEYFACIKDLIEHDAVLSMKQFNQHRGVDCLEHCINVSFNSFRICKRLGLDYRSAARGGLLHDFFLYDWHIENPYGGLHGFSHPKIAAMNANKHFSLNKKEHDVIVKHMWPLTLALPRYLETFVIIFVDKYFCINEAFTKGCSKTTQIIETPAY